jgi:hypothetical protein
VGKNSAKGSKDVKEGNQPGKMKISIYKSKILPGDEQIL